MKQKRTIRDKVALNPAMFVAHFYYLHSSVSLYFTILLELGFHPSVNK